MDTAKKKESKFPFDRSPHSDVPLWVQLRQRLIYLIITGYFEPGDRLPTVRELASEISISYNTVNKAYLSLISEGYLRSIQGKGVFVRDLDAEADEEFNRTLETLMDNLIEASKELGLSYDDMLARITQRIKLRKCSDANVTHAIDRDKRSKIVEIDVDSSAMRKSSEETGA